jgi:Cu/Ag efflux protein CusF
MKKRYSLALAAAIAVCTLPAMAAETAVEVTRNPATSSPGGTVTEVTVITATVTAIDQKARTVTLKDDQGQSVTLNVAPQVKNFAQVKKGDKVTIEKVDSVGIFVTPKGEAAPAAGQASYIEAAKPGQKPSAIAVKTETVTATVQTIDYNTRMVTLLAPNGNTRTLKVGPEAKRFNEVKVGDQVTITATASTAISVSAPQKK